MTNRILEKRQKGVPSVGTFTQLKSMEAIEALGQTELDYVVIDTEHCPTSVTEEARYLTAADAAGLTPLVRVNEPNRGQILHALDAGARGIIVPCIESAEQVRQLVRHAKFKPIGDRGYCMTRDGQWGYGASYANGLAGYMWEANAATLLIPQCETLGCLEQIEEIAALEGVDGVMVGPFDLSISLGCPGDFEAHIFTEALERIVRACKANGKLLMIFAVSPEDCARRFRQGFDTAIVGIDILSLIESYRSTTEKIKNLFEK